jgi:pilus assembly protein CpaE
MRVCIVSEQEATSDSVRQILEREGQECPITQALSFAAINQLPRQNPDVVVLVLSGHVERALSTLSDIRLLTQAKLIAVGPATDSKLILKTLRAGADDYVDVADLETELEAVLHKLTVGSEAAVTSGRVISVLAPSGGSGSSTLAVNMATVLAKEHKRSLLFDLKLETGDLAALLDLKPTHTLADLCQNSTRMDQIMLERSLVRHTSGVHLLAPPRMLADVGYVTPDGVLKALALARSLFSYVILDLDHTFREEQMQVLRQSNVILLVFRLDFSSLRNTQRTLDYLTHKGIPRDRIHLVVNRYGQPKEVPAAKAEEVLEAKISHYIPDDPKTINRANNNGVPAVLEFASAKVCKSIMSLAASVNGRHQET